MTSGSNSANIYSTNMQSAGQHSMGPHGGAPQQGTPTNPSQQPTDQQQLMSPAAGGQQMPMGQPMTAGAFPGTILSAPMGGALGANATPQYQYVVINNQHGQQVLQPTSMSFPGMAAMPAQTAQQPGQQYIITTGLPQQAKQGGQQTHMMASSGAPASQNATKTISQAPTYTLTSSGIVSQQGAPQSQTFMIAHQMNGSSTLQATPAAPSIVPSTGMPSHIKAEPGKPPTMQPAQQPQQVGPQQSMILPPGMAYVNTGQAAPSQAFIQNGQIYVRAPAPTEGQAAPQVMFSPQGIPMQTHAQAIQPGMPTQQLPPGLTTSMQPVTSMASTGTNNVVRAPLGYPSQVPAGKTQISRAPPTLLPATSTSTVTSSRTTTSAPFMTQPSPKSKQKMSPKTTVGNSISTKGSTAAVTKSILNSVRNQMTGVGSVSPPVLTSSASPLSMYPGSPVGPPILQQSVAAPISNAHSQPPLLQPMNVPTSAGNSNPANNPMNRTPVSMTPTTISSNVGFKALEPNGKMPIVPNIKKIGHSTSAAPMEHINKGQDASGPQNGVTTNGTGNGKPPQDYLTHVIDGQVIHESSQPFPLQDDLKHGKSCFNHLFDDNVNQWFFIRLLILMGFFFLFRLFDLLFYVCKSGLFFIGVLVYSWSIMFKSGDRNSCKKRRVNIQTCSHVFFPVKKKKW